VCFGFYDVLGVFFDFVFELVGVLVGVFGEDV